MAQDGTFEQDATRYRFLRDNTDKRWPYVASGEHPATHYGWLRGERLDAALDEALAQTQSEALVRGLLEACLAADEWFSVHGVSPEFIGEMRTAINKARGNSVR
jgi:hypothetical protein